MTTKITRKPLIADEFVRAFFYSKTKITESACVEWQGCKSKTGYGKVKIQGRLMDSHVAAWRIAHSGDSVPVGLVVMHSCDNRACVNPFHLSLGTQSENMKDCSKRCRMNTVKGADHQSSVLTDEVVRQMRSLWDAGKLSQRKIAQMFNVGYSVARAALERRSWRHV